jgi:4'-phosphopantetheinyl transferase
LLGHPAGAIQWTSGPHGKPALSSPTTSLQFNLSHSHAWALLATSFDTILGVDLEAANDTHLLQDMATRILSPDERAHATSPQNLLSAWVRKEACLKALGTGLTRDMDTLTLQGDQAHTAVQALDPWGAMPPTRWQDIALPQGVEAHAALAWLSDREAG